MSLNVAIVEQPNVIDNHPLLPSQKAGWPLENRYPGWMLSRLRLLKLPIWPRSSPWERAAVQLLPDHRQLLGQRFWQLRGLKGMIDPHPQVTVDEQLLPQQRHQIGKRPAEAGLQLQVLDQQQGNQRRPDLRLQGIGGSSDEGLHPQVLL